MMDDEFARHEDEARNLIKALGKLSSETQASPDFITRVMASVDELPTPRCGFFSRFRDNLLWPTTLRLQIGVTALGLLLMLGAISQYATWIQASLLGVSSGSLREAQLQEQLWQKNFDCATKLDQHSTDYAAIDSAQVTVVMWACPSGDVLVTLESPTDTNTLSRRSVWVAFDVREQMAGIWEGILPTAFASAKQLEMARRPNPVTGVVCQKRLPRKVVKRRVRRSNGKCEDEWIKTTNGRLIKRQVAPCTQGC